MIINKRSWHYYVWEWTYAVCKDYSHVPATSNLCSYMQRVVILAPLLMSYLLVAGIILLPLFIVGRLLQIIVMLPFGYRPTGVYPDDYTKFTTATTSQQPNIFKEWIKAKKQKVCPLIEFECD